MKPVITLNRMTLPAWVLTPRRQPLRSTATPAASDAFNSSLMGWENPVTVTRFIAYVTAVVTRFRFVVDTWITLNEPVATVIGVGYIAEIFRRIFLDGARARTAYFNLLKAHVGA